MKKIALFGSTGMLGSMLYNVLKDDFQLILVYRDEKKLQQLDTVYGGVSYHKKVQFDIVHHALSSVDYRDQKYLEKKLGNVDIVLNAAGVINKYADDDQLACVASNSIFPYLLSRIYSKRVIHFSTDCVFDGKNFAPYSESSTPCPSDLYGLSKLHGEYPENALVLRTSFIGPEITGHVSLHDWLLAQKGEITGYTNHYWNGLTTKQVALSVKKILQNRDTFPHHGLFHLYATDVTKYELLMMLQKKYNVPVRIVQHTADPIDRRLRSDDDFCSRLSIPSIETMVQKL